MSMDRTNTDALYKAIARDGDERARLRPILEAIESAEEISTLSPLLKKLHQALMQHFAGEQFPDGLFDVIEENHPEHANSLRDLDEEHNLFMYKVRDLIFRGRTPEAEGTDDLLNDAQELVRMFRDHDEREKKIVEQVLAAD